MPQRLCSRLALGCAIAAVCIELCVSANLLTWIGLPYVSEGGSALLKLHPGTDLLLLASALLIAARPAVLFSEINAALLVYFVAIGGCILSSIMLTGADNLIVLLDTFMPAGLIAALSGRMSVASTRRLRRAMQLLFAANAVLALAETAAQATLIPLYLNDSAYHPHQEDFRPTAMFDHPLTGALMAMMGLALVPTCGPARRPYTILMWAALVAFGGRMAIGVTIFAFMVAKGARSARLILSRDRWAGRRFLLASGSLLLGGLALAAAVGNGLGDRLAGHLYWDDSAQARLAQWDILGQLDGWQLMFGMPRRELLADLNVLRLATGVGVIENFWLLMFISLGAIGFIMFGFAMTALCMWCWRRAGYQGRRLLVTVMIVASTSNSLGRKSTVLVCLVAAIVCTTPGPSHGPGAGSRRPFCLDAHPA